MFVGGGMEEDLGPLPGKERRDGRRIGDIHQAAAQGQVRVGLAQLPVDLVEVVLAMIGEDEAGGPGAGNLAAQLGADGAATTGDQDAAAGQALADGLLIQGHRVAAEQVLDTHRPHLTDGDLAIHEVAQLGHGAEGRARPLAQVHQALHLAAPRHRGWRGG